MKLRPIALYLIIAGIILIPTGFLVGGNNANLIKLISMSGLLIAGIGATILVMKKNDL